MVQYFLLGGQVLVVVLVYLFTWRVMRTARQDLVAAGRPARSARSGDVGAQESTILPAGAVAGARRAAGLVDPRIVVLEGHVLRAGVPFTISGTLTLGRAETNDVVLDDQVVSGRHARIVAPGTLVDEGSTNGTLVNGVAVRGRVALSDGDVVQIGSTVFRYEAPR